ncbi:VWA domain-containing protein [Leptospira langatensis]|uniref:VWA domain-containing protein n=1 Tax=Leptospira langatensis TaxID=2484983 RepID=A0A5F1ZRX8_9LEPT|nr:VWA domain-containing protein [Leptospira langatensis]TGK01955.1 VWA domain-containing protein [Leptospira langatensis]TGL39311.1 VWA domain-containing protein [Leptospira langatensis]
MSEKFLESFWAVLVLIFVCYAFFKLAFYFFWDRWKKKFPGLPREAQVPSFWLVITRVLILGTVFYLSYAGFRQTEGSKSKEEETLKGVDLLFLVDVSLSMQAVDTNPSRLARVKEAILRMLPELPGNRFGMIVFAASPFVYCPMTSDARAFAEYVRGLDADIVGDRGTDLNAAFKKAEEVLSSNQVLRNRILVLATDGEDMDSPSLFRFPADVWVWSVGTPTGGAIAYTDDGSRVSGYLTREGSLAPYENSPGVVISQANPSFLRSLASTNDGKFLDLDSESPNLKEVQSWVGSMEKNTNQRIHNLRRAEGVQKFLLPVVLLLLFDFFVLEFLGKYFGKSRTKLMTALLFVLVLSSSGLSAVELDPGGNRIKEGRNSYDGGDFKGSLEKYKEAEQYFPEDPRLDFNRGDSEYKSGNLDRAIRHFEKGAESKDFKVRSMSHYNLGNAYMKLGDRKKAAEHYLRSLKEYPGMEPAKKNLEWLRKLPPNGGEGSETKDQSQGMDDPIQPGTGGAGENEEGSKQRSKSKAEAGKDPKNKNKSKAEQELDRIMESMDLDNVKRRSPGSRNREVFW